MPKTVPLTPLAESLPSTVPFVGPEAQERAKRRGFLARLGANESVFGPSPRAIAAIEAAAPEAWMYGDPESFELREALAQHHGIGMENVVVGEGIDGLLGYAVRLHVAPGDAVVTSDGAYPTFNYHVAGFGGVLHNVQYKDDAEDTEALLSTAKDTGAKLIYLANPDNPMGSYHSAATITDMIGRLPDDCLLVLDEAYVEFAPNDAIPPLDTSDPRVLRFRTFSKAHGLAGMRVGYVIGHETPIRAFEKIRNHFGMSRVSQAAALAALSDTDWLDVVRGEVEIARARISRIARDNGLTALPSATNFVTIDCGRDGAFAKAVLDQLVERDIFVRMPFAAPGNRCIRVTCAPEADLRRFAEALPLALDAARG